MLSGKKKFELRLQDFIIDEGDTLVLKEWDPERNDYTGREVTKEVTDIVKLSMQDLEKFWTKEELEEKGLQIVSIK